MKTEVTIFYDMAESKLFNLVFHHKGEFVVGNYVGGEAISFPCDEDKLSYFEIKGFLKDMGYEGGYNILAYSLTGDLLVIERDSEVQRAQQGHENGSEIHLYVFQTNGEGFIHQFELDEIYGKNFEGFELRRSPRKHKSSAPTTTKTTKKKLFLKTPRLVEATKEPVMEATKEPVMEEGVVPANVEDTTIPDHVLETQLSVQVEEDAVPFVVEEHLKIVQFEDDDAVEATSRRVVTTSSDEEKEQCTDDVNEDIDDEEFWKRVVDEIETPTPRKKHWKSEERQGESSACETPKNERKKRLLQLIKELEQSKEQSTPRKRSGSSKRSGENTTASVAKGQSSHEDSEPNAAVDVGVFFGGFFVGTFTRCNWEKTWKAKEDS